MALGPSVMQSRAAPLLFLRIARIAAALAAAALLASAATVVTPHPAAQAQDYADLDPELEQRASSLYAGLMCPQCNGQTISQSHAPVAETMRLLVRERLAAQDSDAEIYAFMVEAFGESVLASPPKSGIALTVWIIPPVGLLAGAIALFFAIRKLREGAERQRGVSGLRGRPVRNSGASPGDMEQYLRLVDSEIADGPSGPSIEQGS